MPYPLRVTLKILAPAAFVIYLISDPTSFTPWLASVWGIMITVGMLKSDKDPSGRLTLIVPASVQLVLAAAYVGATAAAINWKAFGQRDVLQVIYAMITISLYTEGFRWLLENVRKVTQEIAGHISGQ